MKRLYLFLFGIAILLSSCCRQDYDMPRHQESESAAIGRARQLFEAEAGKIAATKARADIPSAAFDAGDIGADRAFLQQGIDFILLQYG